MIFPRQSLSSRQIWPVNIELDLPQIFVIIDPFALTANQ
jgi:hypothetical protein